MTLTDTRVQSPLDAARQLAPLIRSYADQIEAQRELPRPVFEALADARLFHLLVPRSLGGVEIDVPTYAAVIEQLALADASTAWCVNQGAGWAIYAAGLPRELARLIWTDTPRSVVANTPKPDATAVAVEGGYRVSGRLSFSTGCRHASWLAPRGRVVTESGEPRLMPNGEPEIRYYFVPRSEAEILDTWHVRGMRGTGTHHFKVDDVFVPEERTFNPGDAFSMTAGLTPREPGPLYAIPRTSMFAIGDAVIMLGTARQALDAFAVLARGKTATYSPGLLREQVLVPSDFGQAEALYRSARAFLFDTVRDSWADVCATGSLSPDWRATLRLATTHATRSAIQVVDAVYNDAGGSAIYQGAPLQRYFQDIHVMSQHVQARRSYYDLVGRYYLGLDADVEQL